MCVCVCDWENAIMFIKPYLLFSPEHTVEAHLSASSEVGRGYGIWVGVIYTTSRLGSKTSCVILVTLFHIYNQIWKILWRTLSLGAIPPGLTEWLSHFFFITELHAGFRGIIFSYHCILKGLLWMWSILFILFVEFWLVLWIFLRRKQYRHQYKRFSNLDIRIIPGDKHF